MCGLTQGGWELPAYPTKTRLGPFFFFSLVYRVSLCRKGVSHAEVCSTSVMGPVFTQKKDFFMSYPWSWSCHGCQQHEDLNELP